MRQRISVFEAMRRAGANEPGEDGSPNPLAARSRRACADFATLVEDLRRDREERTLAELLNELLDRSGYAAHLRDGTEEGEERWANVQELRAKAAGYEDVDASVALDDF